MKLTIIITVYNEVNTIAKAIEEAKNLPEEKEIIVVDNCSTDGTRDILRQLNDDSLQIIYQPKNYGYGKSVRTGMSLARGEFTYVHNSDLEYNIECVHRMLKLAEGKGLDAVFGSRLYGKVKNIFSAISIIKERPYYLGSLITTSLVNILYSRRFTDIIGTRFYRTASFKKIDLESTGIGFDFELVSKLCKKSFKIEETPVSYAPRSARQGKKVKAIDIFPAVTAILRARFF